MSLYDIFMQLLENRFLQSLRQKIIPKAYGSVLEIGIGTGVNLPLYNTDAIDDFTGLDIRLTKKVLQLQNQQVTLIEGSAEQLPFADNSFDTVVATLVLCSVQNQEKSIAEIKRVLKNQGSFIFIEHILPQNKKIARFFNVCNGVWKNLVHGCNLNRKTDVLIKSHFLQTQIEKVHNAIFCYGIAKNEK